MFITDLMPSYLHMKDKKPFEPKDMLSSSQTQHFDIMLNYSNEPYYITVILYFYFMI